MTDNENEIGKQDALGRWAEAAPRTGLEDDRTLAEIMGERRNEMLEAQRAHTQNFPGRQSGQDPDLIPQGFTPDQAAFADADLENKYAQLSQPSRFDADGQPIIDQVGRDVLAHEAEQIFGKTHYDV